MILIANIVKTGKLTRHLIISYIADIVKAKHIIMRHLIATKVKGQQLLLFVTVFAAAESEKKEAIQKGRALVKRK